MSSSMELEQHRNAMAMQSSAVSGELTVEQLVEQTRKIQEVMSAVMREGEHYGVIPGTDKPTLFKPGAEKLCLLFRLDPQYEVLEQTETDGRVSYLVRCTLFHSPSGTRMASGMGEANSLENKYRWHWQTTETPQDRELVDRLREEGTGRFRKGAGGKWQWQLRSENENPMELANTLLKMACKRALIAGVLNATAASDCFTQDLEDLPTALTGIPNLVSGDTLDRLIEVTAEAEVLAPKLWAMDVVVKNASQRFQREIAALAQLSEEEAESIIKGATTWLEANRPDEDGEAEDGEAEKADEAADEDVEGEEPVSAEEVEVVEEKEDE